MNYMIYLVGLQREDFAKSSSDLVQKYHGFESILSGVLLSILASSDNHWVVIIVTEFTSIVTWYVGVVSKHSTVGVPLSDSRAVGSNGFLSMRPDLGAKTFGHYDVRRF